MSKGCMYVMCMNVMSVETRGAAVGRCQASTTNESRTTASKVSGRSDEEDNVFSDLGSRLSCMSRDAPAAGTVLTADERW